MKKLMDIEQAALAVVQRLRQFGHEAYYAGGSVRDMLIGQPPTDMDVATDAPPERIIELFRQTRKVGAKFGVVMVRQNIHWIETATFRTDLSYQDGRRPDEVVFTDAREDAQRRDFTINGLFYDPVEEKVIDYVGGQEDIEAGIVRAIGEPQRRFEEDHLRMLRAVRFATRLNFHLDEETAAAIQDHAAQIERISPERIREELEKMFCHPGRAKALRLIGQLELLPHLWSGSHWPADRLERAVTVLSELPERSDFEPALAALLHECDRAEARRVCQELRCSNKTIDDVGWLVEHQRLLEAAETMELAAFKKLLAHPRYEDLAALYKAYCRAYGLPLDAHEAAARRRDSIPCHEIAPPPLVTGEDLIALGLQPGPQFSRILDRLYDEQLNQQITDREKAMTRLKQITDNGDK